MRASEEPADAIEHELLHTTQGALLQASRPPPDHARYASRGEFMQVGVPRCRQRHTQTGSHHGAENSEIARAGEMDEVACELPYPLLHGVPFAAGPRRAVHFVESVGDKSHLR